MRLLARADPGPSIHREMQADTIQCALEPPGRAIGIIPILATCNPSIAA